ncbi:MAG: hypothetical protein LBR79_00895 [Oscillospiraceae bacterium]|nr:hypothetical protein [Oscillospiraceae bacterium]
MITKISKKIYMSLNCVVVSVIMILLCSCGNNQRTFTKPEYIKEVIAQKSNFDNVLDNFLDQADTYNGTEESIKRMEGLINQAETFIKNMQEQLGPKVPNDSKEHYSKMMKAYKKYLEAMRMYQEFIQKDLGEERSKGIKAAEGKLNEANNDMKNL